MNPYELKASHGKHLKTLNKCNQRIFILKNIIFNINT